MRPKSSEKREAAPGAHQSCCSRLFAELETVWHSREASAGEAACSLSPSADLKIRISKFLCLFQQIGEQCLAIAKRPTIKRHLRSRTTIEQPKFKFSFLNLNDSRWTKDHHQHNFRYSNFYSNLTKFFGIYLVESNSIANKQLNSPANARRFTGPLCTWATLRVPYDSCLAKSFGLQIARQIHTETPSPIRRPFYRDPSVGRLIRRPLLLALLI